MQFKVNRIDSQEKKISALSQEELAKELNFNVRMRSLGMDLLGFLTPGVELTQIQETVLLLFLFKALENLRAIELLVVNGYLAQAGSLMANSIELFLLSRKIKTQPSAAQKWLQGQRWAITGRNGLCKEFKLVKLEKIYSDFSSMKHTQSDASQLNMITREHIGAFGTMWSSPLARSILSANLSAVGDTIRDTSEILSKAFDADKFKKWQGEYDKLRLEIKDYYSKI